MCSFRARSSLSAARVPLPTPSRSDALCLQRETVSSCSAWNQSVSGEPSGHPIWPRSRYCSAMPTWRQPASTCTWRAGIWTRRSILSSIWRSPDRLIVFTIAWYDQFGSIRVCARRGGLPKLHTRCAPNFLPHAWTRSQSIVQATPNPTLATGVIRGTQVPKRHSNLISCRVRRARLALALVRRGVSDQG